MIEDHLRLPAGLRHGALVLAAATILVLVLASAAMAESKELSVFKQCPTKNPSVTLCLYIRTHGGEFIVGSKTVPITKTLVLQGGTIVNEETGEETFVPAANGNTLSKTPLTVPGGLIGVKAPTWWPKFIQEWFNNLINEGFIGVTATAELVGTPSVSRDNLLFQSGTALSLPVRLHLNNEILGGECYIGTTSNPVIFNLTTGTTSPPEPNQPITGVVGQLEFKDESQIAVIKGNKVVDNAFPSPGTEGCGGAYALFVNPIVESVLGVPSGSGHNTAILENTLENATSAVVKNAGY
jgi:hypothetical protein